MGIPKFFRWMSERYPLCSQLIEKNNIPEFDNLYLDMNGIIHNSTHKNDHGLSGSLSEEKMYMAIFNYIEHLFGTIKPKKVFFMAIDGCAPRAKMNQQRSRRFRTAKDAHDARQAAIKRGEELPKEDPFDSNCITPGTVFMARLSRQLQYFVNKKVSEDADWRGVKIILSGHDVPGEGEHKIMEYIRSAKTLPDYDPNVRECLYGLDADLIMLGLLSHEPHFCLLREEVTFGPPNSSKTKELDQQNFYLMHLSLLREYLELEFKDMRETLPFDYDLERIIDDFILMAFFVGNDFLPHLPNLHINEGALALMYKVYRKVLPLAGGYINDNGVINKDRLKLLLHELEQFEKEYFEAESHDANAFKSQAGHLENMAQAKARNRLILTEAQRQIVNQIKELVRADGETDSQEAVLASVNDEENKAFVDLLANDLSLKRQKVRQEVDGVLVDFVMLSVNDGPSAKAPVDIKRELARYAKAPVVKTTLADAEAEMQAKYDAKFDEWKSHYYQEKLGFKLSDEDKLRAMAENYCEGLQWVLFYYYRGVASWGWFYAYHYSPKISDVKRGLEKDLTKFDYGKPFHPFEQLMGVLPERSKKLVPEPFQELMTEDVSPIKDFYPNDFPLDMNGKKADWEAVVKIPFIDESRLLSAMRTKEARLTAEERSRNVFGDPIEFVYDGNFDNIYPSSLPGFFPDLRSHCRMSAFELPSIEGVTLRRGLTAGVSLGVDSLAGFPTLYTLEFSSSLDMHGINVFQRDSKNETVVLRLSGIPDVRTEDIAKARIGKRVFINWPYLLEAEVKAVSDSYFRYELADGNGQSGQVIPLQHRGGPDAWLNKGRRTAEHLSKRYGIVTGEPSIVLHCAPLRGLRRTDDGAMLKDFTLEGNEPELDVLLQTVVDEVVQEDARYQEREALDITIDFPVGQKTFFLGEYNYGRPARVTGHTDGKVDVVISALKARSEPAFGKQLASGARGASRFYPAPVVSRQVGMSSLVLSKLTSSFQVTSDTERANLGLNLKFEGKKLKVLGYTQRTDHGWEYSERAIALIQDYKRQFPQFIAALERTARKANHAASDLFAPQEASMRMKEIKQWLKQNEVKNFDKVPLEAQELDREVIHLIETEANKYNAVANEVEAKKVRGAPRSALLKPEDAANRLGSQSFALGDRVIYVADSGKVPIATRGTTVGVHKDTLDIVFDSAFMSGTMLGGRCSEYRGMTVPYWSVLNLTAPCVLAASKAGVRKAAPAASMSQDRSRPGHHTGSNGHTQVGRAAAPSLQNGLTTQRLMARKSQNQQSDPHAQYHNGSDRQANARNFAPRDANAWQKRQNNQFLQSMMQQGQQQQQQQQVVMNNGMPTIVQAPAVPSATHQHSQNGPRGRGHGRGRGRGRGRGGATTSAEA
ncbi:exonuclease II Exo2 [Savitreella phatthalungensis]